MAGVLKMGAGGTALMALVMVLGAAPVASAGEAKIDAAVLSRAADEPDRDLAIVVICTTDCTGVETLMHVTPDQGLADLGMVSGMVNPANLAALADLDVVLSIELDAEQSIRSGN